MAAHELVPLPEVIPGLSSFLVLARTLPHTRPIPGAPEDTEPPLGMPGMTVLWSLAQMPWKRP